MIDINKRVKDHMTLKRTKKSEELFEQQNDKKDDIMKRQLSFNKSSYKGTLIHLVFHFPRIIFVHSICEGGV